MISSKAAVNLEPINEKLLVINPQRKPFVKEIAKLAKALNRLH
ncbi:MAG: hypothetical protein QM539_08040 [Alphaproteobacteria bacterium]|nr:hypothetical protein [Alphaproteobacteria bacterium]